MVCQRLPALAMATGKVRDYPWETTVCQRPLAMVRTTSKVCQKITTVVFPQQKVRAPIADTV